MCRRPMPAMRSRRHRDPRSPGRPREVWHGAVSGLNVEGLSRPTVAVGQGGTWYLASRIGRHGPAVRREPGDDHVHHGTSSPSARSMACMSSATEKFLKLSAGLAPLDRHAPGPACRCGVGSEFRPTTGDLTPSPSGRSSGLSRHWPGWHHGTGRRRMGRHGPVVRRGWPPPLWDIEPQRALHARMSSATERFSKLSAGSPGTLAYSTAASSEMTISPRRLARSSRVRVISLLIWRRQSRLFIHPEPAIRSRLAAPSKPRQHHGGVGDWRSARPACRGQRWLVGRAGIVSTGRPVSSPACGGVRIEATPIAGTSSPSARSVACMSSATERSSKAPLDRHVPVRLGRCGAPTPRPRRPPARPATLSSTTSPQFPADPRSQAAPRWSGGLAQCSA
jgi:hypothetical protein